MFDKLEDLKRGQLDEILALYRANPLEGMTVAEDDALANKDAAMAEIERLRKEFGYPHTVSAADLTLNPQLVTDGFKEGELIYLSQEEVDEETRKKAEAEVAAKEAAAAEEAAAAAKAAADGEKGDENAIHGPVEPVGPAAGVTEELVYRGKTVIRHSNKLVHGKSYVEVDVSGEVYTLTPEEFESDVKPRGHA